MTGRRIAMVGPSLRGGGLERVLRDLAIAFADRGDVPAVFTVAGLGLHADALDRRGIPVFDCQQRGRRIPGYPRKLLAALRRFAPDVIHAHSGTWLPSVVAGALLRRPVVFTDHGRYPPEPWTRSVIERGCHALTAELVCVSSALATYDQTFLHLKAPPTVIPNGIDLRPYRRPDDSATRRRLRREWNVSETDVVGIVVGRFEPVKDHRGMIEALAVARRSAPSLKLVFLGAGSLEAELRDQCRSLGVMAEVGFLGYRTDVPDCLAAADFWLLGSTTEGLPIGLLEALAAGLPVVATAVGGIAEALGTPTAGLLVPAGAPAAMAEAMVRLANAPDERARLAVAASARGIDFSLDRTVEQYSAVLDRAIGRSGTVGR